MDIRQKQHLLGYLGYYKIPVDGVWGYGSRQATLDFQRDYGLDDDGKFGPETEKRILEVISTGEKPQIDAPLDFWDTVPHFRREEFACKCHKYCNGYPVEPDERLVQLLEKIREHFNAPVIIHSGIRCERHNANVGGSPRSKHKEGIAADFHIPGVPHTEIRDYIESIMPSTGGIGIYDWGIHVDVREVKGRWDYRSGGGHH